MNGKYYTFQKKNYIFHTYCNASRPPWINGHANKLSVIFDHWWN